MLKTKRTRVTAKQERRGWFSSNLFYLLATIFAITEA
jgi:hypothetical protein